MILVTTYYNEPNKRRAKEYEYCLNQNLSHPLIDRVILLSETAKHNISHPKLTVIVTSRPTIGQMFNIGRKYSDRVIVANADVCFDETLSLTSKMGNEVWALSRINVQGSRMHPYHKPDSQDCWIFNGIDSIEDGICTIGQLGCDNRFIHDLHEQGIKVTNPCLSVNVLHYHESAVRNYHKKDTIAPPHKTIHPTRL
jgi:hypothetical protein